MAAPDLQCPPQINPFAVTVPGLARDSAAPRIAPAQCSLSHLLERGEAGTPKAQALAAAIRTDLERLAGIVERADAKGKAMREIHGLEQRLTQLQAAVADLDAAEEDDEAAGAPATEASQDSPENAAPDAEACPAPDGAAQDPARAPGPESGEACAAPGAASPQLAARIANRERSKELAHSRQVRAWAAENGHEVSTGGRLRNEVISAYLAAHPGTGPADG